MQNVERNKLGLGVTPSRRRVTVSITSERLVETRFLQPGTTLPIVVEPSERLDPLSWARNNRDYIESLLQQHGGILFRHFDLSSATQFEQFINAISDELLEYRERSSPRSRVSGNIYTSTDYPANQTIFLHNENSYQRRFNLKIFFFCVHPGNSGGETPIADCRKVYERVSPDVRQRFVEKKWLYVRNYGEGFGLPWQTVFQTTNRSEVEEHCRERDIEFEWKSGDRLRTRAVLPAIARHPKTKEPVWFNHATFFHVSSLEPWIRDALLEEFGSADELPTNTCYGDGEPIEADVLEELRAAYRAETVSFPWQRGDVMLLDNMLAAHGRAPYSGPRKILVGMSEPIDRRDL
jgi:alpha-ketoglutarate-dependent taurine dioxygenase